MSVPLRYGCVADVLMLLYPGRMMSGGVVRLKFEALSPGVSHYKFLTTGLNPRELFNRPSDKNWMSPFFVKLIRRF